MKITKNILKEMIEKELKEAMPSYMSDSSGDPKIGDIDYIVYKGYGDSTVAKIFTDQKSAENFVRKDQDASTRIYEVELKRIIDVD
jgi:hypothetical protein